MFLMLLPILRGFENHQAVRKARGRKKDDVIVIDLKPNNEVNSSKHFILNHLTTLFIASIVTIVFTLLYFAGVSLNISGLPLLEFNTGIIIAAGVMITVYLFLIGRRKKFLTKLLQAKKEFNRRDLVFTDKFLEINPFIIGDEEFNPDLDPDIKSAESLLRGLDMVKVAWSAMEKIEIDEVNNSGNWIYYIRIKAGDKDLYLNRLLFGYRERRFLSLVKEYSNVKIENKSKHSSGLVDVPKTEFFTYLITASFSIVAYLIILKALIPRF